MSSAVLEARAVIVGQDKTKAAFDSIEARINKLVGRIAAIDRVMGRVDAIAGPMNRATTEVRKFEIAAESMKLIDKQAEAVRRSFTETAHSIEKATAAASKFGKVRIDGAMAGHAGGGGGGRGHGGHSRFESLREFGVGLAPTLGLGLAIGGAEAVNEAVKGGMARQHERTRMATSGMNPREIAETEGLSADLSAQYTPVGQTEIMHLMRNARSVVGSYDEAAKILKPLLDLRVVAAGAHPGENMEEDFDQLIKGMEIKGVTQDPAKFKSYINAMGKAVNAFGDTLRPTDFYEMFKYGRQSTSGFSQDYMMTVAPTLAQEMKGSSAGVANSAFFRAIVGGRMEKVALARMEELGLVDKSKLFTPPGGHLVSAAGAVKGWQLAQINPYEWVDQILLPAMQKKGIVDPQKIQEVINSVFSNQVAAQMVGIYATQQQRIEKDRGVIAGTMDTPEAARRIMETDPTVAAEGLKNALENLGSTFADKTLHLASGMTSMAEAINRFSAQIQHAYDKPPVPGEILPGQGKFNRLMNDVDAWTSGLTPGHSSGGQADGHRASLIATAKAAAANADGLDYDSYENARNAGRLRHDASEREPKTFWDSLWADDSAPRDRNMADMLSGQSKQNREDAAASRELGELGRRLDEVGQRLDANEGSLWRQAINGAPPPPTIPSGAAFPSGVGDRAYGDLPLPSDEPWNPQHPAGGGASPPAEEHHDVTADDLKAAFSGANVLAQLDPNSKATIEASFEVKPSSDLLQLVEKAKSIVASGSLAAGGIGASGSTGLSYPETAPSGRGIGRN